MGFREVLEGGGEPLGIYDDILAILDEIQLFPASIEP